MPSAFKKFTTGRVKDKRVSQLIETAAGPSRVSSQTGDTGIIYLRVPMASLYREHADQPTGGSLYLIQGTLEDMARYADSMGWLIKIAQLLCKPLGTGQVFTHTTNTVEHWLHTDRDSTWREVAQAEDLCPGIFEYAAPHQDLPIILSKISTRRTHSDRSVTDDSARAQSNSSTFKSHIYRRDHGCVLSGQPNSLIASHIIPKRNGNEGAQAIVEQFAGAQEANGIHRFDPRIGVLLISSLDHHFDLYEFGFYHIGGNTYRIHNFCVEFPDMMINGCAVPSPLIQGAQLHRHVVTLTVHQGDDDLPPPGVFNWHYLQCVICRFGTPQFQGFYNIRLFELPYRTAGDDSDEDSGFDDTSPTNPPYPSYYLDQYGAQEQHKEILQWVAGISAGPLI